MNTLLLSASRAGDVDSCRRIVRDMVELYKMPISQVTLNTQLHGIARALKVRREMSDDSLLLIILGL
jgi:hypothetical protein